MNEDDCVRTELAKLVGRYGLGAAKVNGNEEEAFEGNANGNPVRLELYEGDGIGGPWLHVELAFGEVRHADGRSRIPLGERGVVGAASDFGPGCGGTSLPGHKLTGFRWRVSAVAPTSRTLCAGPGGRGDGYVQVTDIVEHMLTFEETCMNATAADGDFFRGAWEAALPGW